MIFCGCQKQERSFKARRRRYPNAHPTFENAYRFKVVKKLGILRRSICWSLAPFSSSIFLTINSNVLFYHWQTKSSKSLDAMILVKVSALDLFHHQNAIDFLNQRTRHLQGCHLTQRGWDLWGKLNADTSLGLAPHWFPDNSALNPSIKQSFLNKFTTCRSLYFFFRFAAFLWRNLHLKDFAKLKVERRQNLHW